MSDRIKPCLDENGSDRCGLPTYMAWARAGATWTVCGGTLSSRSLGQMPLRDATTRGNLSFVRFPDLLFRTGDLGHVSKPQQFDTVHRSLQTRKAERIFHVPSGHDVFAPNEQEFGGNVSFHTALSRVFPQPASVSTQQTNSEPPPTAGC